MLIFGSADESPKEIYSFVDSESTDDINTNLYLESKQFRGIWNLCKAIRIVKTKENLELKHRENITTAYELIFWVLSQTSIEIYPDLLDIITSNTEYSDGKLALLRLKIFCSFKLAKFSGNSSVPLPDKITPILQTIVTGYTNETIQLIRQKLSKTAARITLAALNRTCNERFIGNLLKIDPLPVLKDLQDMHKEEIVNRFKIYTVLTCEKIENSREMLKLLTVYIHPALNLFFSNMFHTLISNLHTEDTNVIAVNMVTQIEDCMMQFIECFLCLAEKNQLSMNLLLILLDLVQPKFSPKLIPYSACFVLPLLKNLSSEQGAFITKIFGEILNLVLLDSSDTEISSNLQKYRDEGLHFLGQLKGSYALPVYVSKIVTNGIELRDYQKEGIA